MKTGLAFPAGADTNPGPGLAIDYPQKNIPFVEVPRTLESDTKTPIPETLDIATRCELAINAMTGIADPK